MRTGSCNIAAGELLGAVGVFADVGFVCASQRTKKATEEAWILLAKERFGQWVVDPYKDLKGSEEGYASWREMIADDAKKLGMWCLDVSGASQRNTPGASSEGRIQRVAIDGLADGELVAVVEGYGRNLNDGLGSVLHADGARIPHISGTASQPGTNKFQCTLRSKSHQICRMTFASQASARRATRAERDTELLRQQQPNHHVRDQNDQWQLVAGPSPQTPLPECYDHSGWDTSNTSPSSTVTRSNNQSALSFCARTPGRPGTPSSAGRVLSPRARHAGDSCRARSRFQRPSERRARPGNRAHCGATSGPCGAHHPLKSPSPILHPNYSFPQTISSRSKTTHANCAGALSSRACVASNLASPPRHRRGAMRG